MSDTQTLRGLTTVSFWTDDLAAAKKWYAELLGSEPYFERPGYAEFRIEDHVDDLTATFNKLMSMGAKEYEAPTERGVGFITASVVDPFGNILGIMYNQHYLDVLISNKKA
jgi:catechol 2,3-dioxygenase-like lactoylglutathione lyase family enzyme